MGKIGNIRVAKQRKRKRTNPYKIVKLKQKLFPDQ